MYYFLTKFTHTKALSNYNLITYTLNTTVNNIHLQRLRETVLRPLYGTDNPHLRWIATILTVDTSIVSDILTLA